MGFALPAHLPLERYIGSCLISPCPPPPPQFSPPPLQPRKFQRQFYNSKTLLRNVNGPPPPDRASYPPNRSLKTNQRHGLFKEPEGVWTIGVPLLAVQPFVKSKNTRTTKKNRKYGGDHPPEPDASEPPRMLHNRSQFSKLAVHTQGVPLIQSSRYEQSCKLKSGKAGNSSLRNAPLDPNKIASAQSRKDSAGSSGKTGESSSVNSDENLSCNSLENSLPRIIKPRKRRKKDRKPNGVPSAEQRAPDDNNNTPREDDCGKEATKKDGGQPNGSDKAPKAPEDQCAAESGNPDDAAKENESAEKGISCQCRYCDPSSVIWNVNTRGYSPSLVSCILPVGADHQHRSSGPVSVRGSGPPTPDSHAKFPPFGAPLEAKPKMPPNDCRFPPPNFHRPPNEPYPFPFSPPYNSPPRIPMSSPSDRGGFAELYAASKINFPSPEQKLPEFTQRFGLLNVSNFHVPTGFIDTSRPPPPIPPKIEEPPPRIPNYAALVSNRRSWEGHDANGAFRKNEAQLYQSSEFLSPEESSPKAASPWPVFNEEHRVVERAPARTPEKVVVDESPSPLGSSPARSQNLEVSSEIVTSPNGHRDIEIKFFMTSSPAAPSTQPFMTFPSCAKVPEFTPSLKTGT